MIKIPIDIARWKDNVDVGGGLFGKSLSKSDRGVEALWWLGDGVLVERKSLPTLFVPSSNVAAVEGHPSVTATMWGDNGATLAMSMTGAEVPAGKSASVFVPEAPPEEPKKRGPGRPPKV